MADYGFGPDSGSGRTERVVTILDVVAVASLVLGLSAGTMLFFDATGSRSESGAIPISTVAYALLSIASGLTIMGLLWGLAESIRASTRVAESQEDLNSTVNNLAARAPRQGQDEDGSLQWEELVLLVRELRDISLLGEDQRKMRLEAQGRAALERLQREVPVLLREHNWLEARGRVLTTRERFPQLREWDALEKQIESMRSQVEQHDIEAAERQIKDLVALDAWHRVEEVLTELLQRHPDSIKAIELGHRIRAERHKALAEARARLMIQAQDAVNRRDWRTALEFTNTLIQRYPQSTEAQQLKLQLPILRANADTKARQELESRITEALKQRKYDDAMRLTREMLDNYPNSKQAEKLREMLPDIEKKVFGG